MLFNLKGSIWTKSSLEPIRFFTATGAPRGFCLTEKLVGVGVNFLVVDEPINHLDITLLERFEATLDAFPGAVLVITHDRVFTYRFSSGIWVLEGGKMLQYLDRVEMRNTS